MLNKLTAWPFHPFLFSLYVVLAIAASDPSLIFFVEGWRSIIVLLLAAGLALGAFYLACKNIARAGYLVTLLIFLIFMYGHLRRALSAYTIGGFSISDDRWFFPFWALLIALLASGWLWRRIQHPELISRVFNLVALAALAVPLFTVVMLGLHLKSDPLQGWQPSEQTLPALSSQHPPDIYYIILDGYGREDILTSLYGFDNRPFLASLEEMGFFIASQSRSNYMRTSQSVPSTLNFDYLSELEKAGQDTANWFPLRRLISDSRIRQVLDGQGYTFVAFSSGFHYTEIQDADVYLSPHRIILNSFEQLVVGVSAFEIAARAGWLDVPVFSYHDHRHRILYTFDQLARLPVRADLGDAPKFIFAHITIPHPPFVFNARGNPVEPHRGYSMGDANEFDGSTAEYLTGYRDQLIYTNQLVLEMLNAILAQSPEPPVIILQGDHGPGAYLEWTSLENTCWNERMSVLNAYYLPGVDDPGLYPAITPVNTFRVVLNAYFGAKIPLLEDRSFASTDARPYRFQDVTSISQQACADVLPPP
jgi:hypothetical protein